ncbi:hypothetical protein MASR1M48_17370 [Lactococcus petauri]
MENTAGPALPYAVRSDRKTAGTTSTGAVNGTFVDIPFETNDLNEGVSALITKPNNTDFRLALPGIYRASVTLIPDSGANDTGWEGRAVLDGVAIPQSAMKGSSRANNLENYGLDKTFVFKTVSANQVVKMQAAPLEGAAVDIVKQSTFFVELIRLT